MFLSMCILLIVFMSCVPVAAFRQTTFANLYQMCPYNDFCYSSATKSIKEEDANPCCRPCNCDEDCWKFGTCCPDKDGNQREPAWPCKRTGGKNSYFITDSCPNEENRTDILDKCSKQNVTSFEDIIWVSDSVTGLIYQNQFCADCHGVKNILHWHARTNCLEALDNEKGTQTINLDAIMQTPTCEIIMEVPQSLIDTTEPYQCLIPDYNRCNETGHWEHTNQTIETACNAFSMPYVVEYLYNFEIYRNVFCYICNIRHVSEDPLSKIQDATCLVEFPGRTSPSFSMLIDFKRYFRTEEAKLGYRCGVSEIFDPYLDVCHQMRCPFGSRSYKGVCEKLIPETEGLGIVASHSVQTLYSNLTVSTLSDSFINKIGVAVFKQIKQILAFDDTQCKVCSQDLRLLENNRSLLLADFLLNTEVRTAGDCSYESVIAKLTGLIGQKISVHTKQSKSLVFLLKLAVADFENTSVITSYNSGAFCSGVYVITSEKNCAKMKLRYELLQNSPVLQQKEATLAKILIASTPNDNESYVDICIDDYFSLMSQVNQAPFLQCYLPALVVKVVARYLFNN